MPKITAVISDLHFPYVNKKSWRAFKKWVVHVKPYRIVILGDALDVESISKYGKSPNKSPYLANEIKEFVDEVNWLYKYCKNIDIVQGNHELRLESKIAESLGYAAKGLAGLSIKEQLYLQGMNTAVKYHKESTSFRGLMVGGVLLRHGDKQSGGKYGHGKHVAATRLEKSMGQNEIIGHTHRLQMFTKTAGGRTAFAISNGCMSADHDYVLDPDWAQSFIILEVFGSNDSMCTPYPVLIQQGKFSWGGVLFNGSE